MIGPMSVSKAILAEQKYIPKVPARSALQLDDDRWLRINSPKRPNGHHPQRAAKEHASNVRSEGHMAEPSWLWPQALHTLLPFVNVLPQCGQQMAFRMSADLSLLDAVVDICPPGLLRHCLLGVHLPIEKFIV
jgi:hypothetical protein